jgi:hypothetical protein
VLEEAEAPGANVADRDRADLHAVGGNRRVVVGAGTIVSWC